MPKKKSKVVETSQVEPQPVQVEPQPTQSVQAEPAPQSVKKRSYNPERARAYREKLKAAAIAGGYVFKERKAGSGVTVKKVSKTGKEYYYQPWSTLTEEQKKARLEAARKRAALERELARKYKEEHSIDTKKEVRDGENE
ncbi:MAG: hypothetical protein QW212_00615 [Nitrososphaerales archaeon]